MRVAATLGVRKLRITGGEPLLRKGLAQLIGRLGKIDGIQDMALTTNGVLLADQAQELYDVGLRRLNIHLDTLDRERFKQITRRDDFGKVMDGIETALRVGYPVIKINAVAVKNLVEEDIVPLARFGRENGIEIRYIEFMPLDAQGIWDHDKVLLTDDMIAMLLTRRRSVRCGRRFRICAIRGLRLWNTNLRMARARWGSLLLSVNRFCLGELQSHTADGGWEVSLLLVRD